MPGNPFWTSLWVFLGAGIGANARYWIGVWSIRRFEVATIGTLTVNVAGSLAMGVLIGLVSEQRLSSSWMPFLAAGLLGGFTTFSAYSGEAMQLIQARQFEVAALYILGSVLLSLLAGFVGYSAAIAVAKAF